MRVDRNFTIDLCRGLLFILMMNTHALTIAMVPREHWLFSDLWLPNGWATVVFVVLSGFGVGYIYSVRQSREKIRDALYRRSVTIFGVMFVSNALFAALRQATNGGLAPIATLQWWLGFITLDTPWTISGVLLPTGLVLLFGPGMIRMVQLSPWLTLCGLAIARVLLSILVAELGTSTYATSWAVRLFLLEGFGGFPVLPFLVNGCIGIWLGVQRHTSEAVWWRVMGILILMQAGIYWSTLLPDVPLLKTVLASASAPAKFSVMFLVAVALVVGLDKRLTAPIALIGKYALASFVMHRIFLQIIGKGLGAMGLAAPPGELRYFILFAGAFSCTWCLCFFRTQSSGVNTFFCRFGL